MKKQLSFSNLLLFLSSFSLCVGQNFSLEFQNGSHVAMDDQSIEQILGTSWTTRKTISAWIIPTGQSLNSSAGWNGQQVYGQNQMGFGFGNTHGISRGIINNEDKIWVYNWDGTDDRIGIDYEVDELMHVAMVHNGGILYAYKNGVLVDQINSNSTADGGYIRIGGGTENGNAFNGFIDEIRVWNTARSGNEILNHMYMQLSGDEVGLAGYWNFNEGQGEVAYDITENQNHGEIIGANYSTETYSPCNNDEIVLWNYCFSVENTVELILPSHEIIGDIPSNIGELTNLTTIILSNNQLTGSIPSEIGNLVDLHTLDLSGNQLTGSIPNEISELSQLSDLNLYYNRLSGELPESFQYMINLNHIDLSGNQFTGSFENAIIQNADSLAYLNISFNQLTGEIPHTIGELHELKYLFLNNNSISGPLPTELFQLDKLKYLWLSSNEIEGSIPPEIIGLSNLQQLFINDNFMGGILPEELCNLSVNWDGQVDIGLTNFSISNNSFCPPYPNCIENQLGNQDISNCSEIVSIYERPIIKSFSMHNPFPNPFNPIVSLSFEMYDSEIIDIMIYDILGRPVKKLLNKLQQPGYQRIYWDGTDESGSPVSSGTYVYSIRIGNHIQNKKIVLLK